ncbi:MAG TPA: response regulator [Anaeromyxobacter sp.]|nr:response regulator [Anaeromyxobacter sp.]
MHRDHGMNATTSRRPRALLLDDDPTVLRLLGSALEARGFDVRAALDAQSGIEILTDELFDLDVLVVDADLPGRDGAALLHLVRCAGGERDLGIVVLAADPASGLRARLLGLGADAVLDRARGHDAAAEVVAGLASRTEALARTWLDGAGSAVRGALSAVRAAGAALAPRRGLAGVAA